MKYKYSYLIYVHYLGFRFHGWQKQNSVMSLHEMIDKTLRYSFTNSRFKTLGSGRTDSKVSSTNYPLQLFLDEEIIVDDLKKSFNKNAPSDLKIVSISKISDPTFNIIQSVKLKVYHYYFSNTGKNHPYASPFMTGYEGLNIDLMNEGARLFEGHHFFGNYCTKPNIDTNLFRSIKSCEIKSNTYLSANFFPDKSYVLKVIGTGFLRYQIRLMMGALVELGTGNMTLKDIEISLIDSGEKLLMKTIAPGSGLHLYDVDFTKK